VKYPGADEAGFAGATGSLRWCLHGLRKIRLRRRLLRIRRFHDSPFRVRTPTRSIVRRRDIHRCGSMYPMKSYFLSKAPWSFVEHFPASRSIRRRSFEPSRTREVFPFPGCRDLARLSIDSGDLPALSSPRPRRCLADSPSSKPLPTTRLESRNGRSLPSGRRNSRTVSQHRASSIESFMFIRIDGAPFVVEAAQKISLYHEKTPKSNMSQPKSIALTIPCTRTRIPLRSVPAGELDRWPSNPLLTVCPFLCTLKRTLS